MLLRRRQEHVPQAIAEKLVPNNAVLYRFERAQRHGAGQLKELLAMLDRIQAGRRIDVRAEPAHS